MNCSSNRRTEASFNETTFNGFDVPEGAYLPGPPVPTRRLEVIGDSISAAYGNEGVYPCQFTSATEITSSVTRRSRRAR